MKILVVEDDMNLQILEANTLRQYGEVVATDRAEDALMIAKKALENHKKIDIALIDNRLQGQMSGLELGERLRIELGADAPLMLFISGVLDDSTVKKAYEVGFLSCLSKPGDIQRLGLIARTYKDIAIKVQEGELDPLTRFPNRRYFKRKSEAAFQRFKRESDSAKFGVLFIDLLHFKETNDKFGHFVADEVLMVTGRRILSVLGESAVVARVAGDEFQAIVNVSSREELKQAAAKVSKNFENAMALGDKIVRQLVSVGYAYCEDEATLEALLEHADSQMYMVKENQKRIISESRNSA